MSKVYRFHAPADIGNDDAPTLLRKRKPKPPVAVALVPTDPSGITDVKGTTTIEADVYDLPRPTVTFTRKESDLIALSNPGAPPPIALEDVHPWLPSRPYLDDPEGNLNILKSIERKYGGHMVSAAAYCDEKWNTICNSIRIKNGLDARFHTAWHLPIQDVHVLEEKRADRTVIAIDFNGMYAACMQHEFPKPASLRHLKYNRMMDAAEELPLGLYRCILHDPTSEFIQRYNPFRTFFSGRHLSATLSEPLEIDLNEFEIAFYRRHFSRIHLVDAVVSDRSIAHPLAREVRRSFARRANYKSQGNKPLADREKYLATLMSSCANRPRRMRETFPNRNAALDCLRRIYGIAPPHDEPEAAVEIWLQGRKGFAVTSTLAGVSIDAPNLRDGSACFLLGQRIVARGRVVLLEMMERILAAAPDVQICYTNIDSVHFSIRTVDLAQTMNWLRSRSSKEMGSFKIEAVTRHGLWLEPGRYWLYDDAVAKFRNRSVGDATHPFKTHAVHVSSRKIGDLHIPIRTTLRMDRTMSPSRSLVLDRERTLTSQHLIAVANGTRFADVLTTLEHNHRTFTPMRMEAFRSLQARMGSSCLAATRQDEDADIM